jgi:hypothetical protein
MRPTISVSSTTTVEVSIHSLIREMTEKMIGDLRLVDGEILAYSRRFDEHDPAEHLSEEAKEEIKKRIEAIETISKYFGIPCYLSTSTSQ